MLEIIQICLKISCIVEAKLLDNYNSYGRRKLPDLAENSLFFYQNCLCYIAHYTNEGQISLLACINPAG